MATDFFDRQADAHRRTGRLVFYFGAAVVLIILTVYAVITAIFFYGQKGRTPDGPRVEILDPIRLAAVAAGTGLVILGGSVFKTLSLREGGPAVARMLDGRLVDGSSREPAERRLLNIVEEMAIASGTPVPQVYVLDREEGINAFAAGYTSGDSVIGVTRGALKHLDRDELQGVIAHEFSHILNGDVRLDVRLIGVLHGILLLALIGEILMRMMQYAPSSRRSSDGEKKDNSALAFFLMGLALYLIGYLGVFFGRLIQAAVSRQREFLADASAVQFTRNPEGIAGALKTIGGLADGSKVKTPAAMEACHMFFGEGVPSMIDLLATHPPLVERIKRLDPSFDGQFPVIPEDSSVDDDLEVVEEKARKPAMPTILPGLPTAGGSIGMQAAAVLASVGTADPAHMAYASELLADLPAPIASAAREPFGAIALIYALLLDDDPAIRHRQLDGIAANDAPGLAREAARLAPLAGSLGPEARVPLVDLALPSLRRLSPIQYPRFRGNVEALIQADQRVSLFEFALQRMLFRHLDRQYRRAAPQAVRFTTVGPLLPSLSALLSSLARIGQEAPEDVERAFRAGAAKLGPEGASLGLVAEDAGSLPAVDQALNALAAASPPLKKRAIDACAACIAADGRVTVEEGELLRAIADSLDCPMPPILPDSVKPGRTP